MSSYKVYLMEPELTEVEFEGSTYAYLSFHEVRLQPGKDYSNHLIGFDGQLAPLHMQEAILNTRVEETVLHFRFKRGGYKMQRLHHISGHEHVTFVKVEDEKGNTVTRKNRNA